MRAKVRTPPNRQLSVPLSLAFETEKQTKTDSGAETECEIEIEHSLTTYGITITGGTSIFDITDASESWGRALIV